MGWPGVYGQPEAREGQAGPFEVAEGSGRDVVTLADERASQRRTQMSTYTGAPVLDSTTETQHEVIIITSHVESGVETDRRGDSPDTKLYRDPSPVCEAGTARNQCSL